MNKSNPKINLFSYTSTHNVHWNVVFSHTPLQKKNIIYKIKCKLLRISLTIIKIHAFNLSHWKDKMDKRIIFGFTFHDKISRNSCNLIYLSTSVLPCAWHFLTIYTNSFHCQSCIFQTKPVIYVFLKLHKT